MKRTALILIAIFSILPAGSPLRAGDDEIKRKLGIGFAYTGALAHLGFKRVWSAEARYFTGKESSNDGDVASSVIGLRGYRHFRSEKKARPYTGIDLSYASASGANYKTQGYVFGAFGGVEYYILRRLSLSMDLGPYYLSLKEGTAGAADSGLGFILNTALNFYIF